MSLLVGTIDVTVPGEVVPFSLGFLMRLPHLVKSTHHEKQKDYKFSICQNCPHLRLPVYFPESHAS